MVFRLSGKRRCRKKEISKSIFLRIGENNVVLELPARRSPGVLIRGDTLGEFSHSADALLAVSRSGDEEFVGEVEFLADRLRAYISTA